MITILLLSPLAASAQTAGSAFSVQTLIDVYTQLIHLLEQEITQLIAANGGPATATPTSASSITFSASPAPTPIQQVEPTEISQPTSITPPTSLPLSLGTSLPTPASSTPSVHPSSTEPDKLVVTRPTIELPPVLAQLADGPYRVSMPAPFTENITNQTTVQKLYADIYALPPPSIYPSGGPGNCPMDTGISYTLDFYQGNTLLLHADYKPTGCGGLNLGDGTSRLTSTSFNDELRKAVGLSDGDFYGR